MSVVLPLLAPGFVLVYDMAFVPRSRLSLELLGVGTALPRSVPFGLLVALASRAVSGMVVQKVVMLAVFGLAGWGAGRLVPAGRSAARAAAGVTYAWNPFTYERLMLGQVAFLLSVAILPWVVASAIDARRGRPGAVRRTVLWVVLAAIVSPYGGLFAGAIALMVTAFPPATSSRMILSVGAAALVANLPWLVPTLLRPGRLPTSAIAFDIFRSRADSPLGLIGSLASLGGLWRTDLAPPGRATLAWVPAFVLILAVAAYGYRLLVDRLPNEARRGIVTAAGVGLLLALGVAAPGVGRAIRWVGLHAPGGAILRDGQKFVAPLALLLSMAFGAGVERLLGRAEAARDPLASHRARTPVFLSVALSALPVALAPTLAWGAAGRLSTVAYPADWARARQMMAADPAGGAILMLPWHLYLPYRWNENRVVIQPGSAYFTRHAVASDALEVGHVSVPPEDPWSALAARAVASGRLLSARLGGLGIRYVVVLKEADWRSFAPQVSGLPRVLTGRYLEIYRVDGTVRAPAFSHPPVVPVVAADLVTLTLFAWAVLPRARRGPKPGAEGRGGRSPPTDAGISSAAVAPVPERFVGQD